MRLRPSDLPNLKPHIREQVARELMSARLSPVQEAGRAKTAEQPAERPVGLPRGSSFYILEGKPRSLKNSRSARQHKGRTYTVRNAGAEAWLQAVRASLKEQHSGPPIAEPCHVVIKPYYQNRRWWLDQDMVAVCVLDALKGIVLKDDSPAYASSLEVRPAEVSRQGRSYVAVEVRFV